MFRSREVNALELTCPQCQAEAGKDASTPVGVLGQWNLCPGCNSLWREPLESAGPAAIAVAETQYFKASRKAASMWRLLHRRSNSPLAREGILAELANLADRMAVSSWTWDNDRTDSDGFTPHEWMTAEARLLRMVMNTEMALARGGLTYGQRLDWEPSLAGLMGTDDRVTDVLWRLSNEPDPAGRGDLVDQLYEAVVDHVGGQAAEVLVAVAACYRKAAQTGWRRFVPWL
jgi:hypothetical protein